MTQRLYTLLAPFALLLLLLHSNTLQEPATNEEGFCGTDARHEHQLQANPALQQLEEQLEKQWQQYEPSTNLVANYTLPVVFHVIHNNGPENLPAGVVQAGLDHLNDAFENVGYYDPSTGVNTQIEFCLAKRDPDGAFTTGINYVQSNLTDLNMDTDDLNMKDLIRWDPTSYINVWIVGEICNINGCGVAGYAYFPSSHGTDVDGIVMEAAYLGSSEANSAVLVHEMGHYLGLYHTFEGGCTNNDCTLDGDRICDTPPDQSTSWVPCGTVVNTCTTDTDSGFVTDQDDMINNYLDYSDFNCYNAFTADQASRMEFFITGIRASLLDSDACMDPCLATINAGFNADATAVNVGATVNFTNTTSGATTYSWTIDGVQFATTTDASYTFPTEGTYTIELIATNADPNCFETFSIEVEVTCQVVASFSASSTQVTPGTVVFFTNFSSNATSYEWLLDGALATTTVGFDNQFDNLGTFDVQLVASNGFCSDTSALMVITVTNTGSAQTGLPVWPMTISGNDGVVAVDWTSDPPFSEVIDAAAEPAAGSSGAGFDGCGDLVFYAAHTGSSSQNQLFIYAPDGTELLSSTTANGPGLNAVRSGQELQVVRVPGIANEWFLIYNEWSSDATAPANNAAYNANRLNYSRIRLTGTDLVVLEKDVLITDGGGVGQPYNDGLAVSRTAFGNPDQHFLYATRRAINSSVLSLDRFLIDQTGITWNANTGPVASNYWNLTHAGSHIELSPTEDRIAVCSRNQFIGWQDYYIFDAAAFNNASVDIIVASDLVLVADGTANDQSSVLPYSAPVSTVAADNNLPLAFLNNFGRKLANLEFSPNGRFLYIVNGGYASGGFTNLTYLAQIDLEASPLEVRLQVQEPPNGIYNSASGLGCATSAPNCLDNWYGVNKIEAAYDGKLYFGKRNLETLFVIPDPNNVMPQNLIPSDIDLSTPDDPNINLPFSPLNFPDQIDGYNYFLSRFREVSLPVTGLDCDGDCRAPYDLELLLNGDLLENYSIGSCPDSIVFCADTTQVYSLYDPILDLTYDSVVVDGMVQLPDNADWFDFSDLEGCVELCSNGIDDDNDGLIDCDDPDLADDCCCQIPTDVLDLGPDQSVCDNGVFTFNAGAGYASYLWQDFSADSMFTAIFPGTYWVTVVDSCGNSFSDTVAISFIPTTELDLGPDLVYCEGSDPLTINATGFDSYTWTPDTYLSCANCPAPSLTPTSDITYIVVGATAEGCVSTDTIEVLVGDTTFTQIDTALCDGSVFTFDGVDIPAGQSATFTYPNQLGCDSTILVNVSQNGGGNTTINLDTSACTGSSVTIFGVAIDAGETFEFNYQTAEGCDSIIVVAVEEIPVFNTESSFTICPGDSIVANGVVITTPLTLATTYTSILGCDSTHTVTVDWYEVATVSIESTASCAGSENGELLAVPEGGTAPFTYQWGHTNNPQAQQTGLAPGPYAVTVMDANGCEVPATADVGELALPDFSSKIVDASCLGETDGSISITTLETGLTYSLDGITFQADTVFNDLSAGIYDLYVQDVNGCVYEEQVILEAPDPVLLSLPPDTTIQLGNAVLINPVVVGGDTLSYDWFPAISLDCGTCETVLAGPVETTEYTLVVTDERGCETTESILIEVEKARLVFIPTGFTPDGDGVNDLFYPFAGAGVTEILDFKVFSRWGELVYADGGFAPNDPSHGWDGQFRGQPMGTGVYVFYVEVLFEDGVREIYEGGIHLVR